MRYTTRSEYSERLKDPRWQKLRLKVFERDSWSCLCCGSDTETLMVHHLVYPKGETTEPWDAPMDTLETLCGMCHQFREDWNTIFGRGKTATKICWRMACFFGPLFDGTINLSSCENAFGLYQKAFAHHFPEKPLPRLRSEKTGQIDREPATVAPSLSASPSETPSEKVTPGAELQQQQDDHRSPVTPGPCCQAMPADGSGAAMPRPQLTSAIA